MAFGKSGHADEAKQKLAEIAARAEPLSRFINQAWFEGIMRSVEGELPRTFTLRPVGQKTSFSAEPKILEALKVKKQATIIHNELQEMRGEISGAEREEIASKLNEIISLAERARSFVFGAQAYVDCLSLYLHARPDKTRRKELLEKHKAEKENAFRLFEQSGLSKNELKALLRKWTPALRKGFAELRLLRTPATPAERAEMERNKAERENRALMIDRMRVEEKPGHPKPHPHRPV